MDSQQQWPDDPSAKVPKLHHHLHQHHSPASALTLFSPQPNTTTTTPPGPSLPTSPLTNMGGGLVFSLSQWQELELQALIYKYMLAGAPVPLGLILPIKRSLITASPYYHHLQSSMVPAGYWGRCVIDPEPGRCRRTDGKKWRCSREVVGCQKYCERHVHRGRNRSRKHVETHTPNVSIGFKATHPNFATPTRGTHFALSGNQRPPDGRTDKGCINPRFPPEELQGDESKGRVLRKFLDEWPRTQKDQTPCSNSNASLGPSATASLSISIPGNSPSDFSLKLSTGNGDKLMPSGDQEDRQKQHPLSSANWTGWGSQMGGPLAEALRSSTSTPSPTSVLQKANGSSVSETSSASI